VNDKKKSVHIDSVDLKKTNSWQTGRLYFQRTPFIEVLDEVNRYMDNKIVLGDSRLANITLSMNFDMKHQKSFLATLEKVLPIKSQTTSDGKIMIFQK